MATPAIVKTEFDNFDFVTDIPVEDDVVTKKEKRTRVDFEVSDEETDFEPSVKIPYKNFHIGAVPFILRIGREFKDQRDYIDLKVHFVREQFVGNNGKLLMFLSTLVSPPPVSRELLTQYRKDQTDRMKLKKEWHFTTWATIDWWVKLFEKSTFLVSSSTKIWIANRLIASQYGTTWTLFDKSQEWSFLNPPYFDIEFKINDLWENINPFSDILKPTLPSWVNKYTDNEDIFYTRSDSLDLPKLEIDLTGCNERQQTHLDHLLAQTRVEATKLVDAIFQQRILACGYVPTQDCLKALRDTFKEKISPFFVMGARKSYQGRPSESSVPVFVSSEIEKGAYDFENTPQDVPTNVQYASNLDDMTPTNAQQQQQLPQIFSPNGHDLENLINNLGSFASTADFANPFTSK